MKARWLGLETKGAFILSLTNAKAPYCILFTVAFTVRACFIKRAQLLLGRI